MSTNGKAAEDIIRAAKLPERSVPVCLHADLVAEHEELNRQLVKAQNELRTSLADGGPGQLAERIQRLEADMAEHTVTFRLRALTRTAWKALIAHYPPRKTEDGGVDPRDLPGVNTDEFFPAMIRACVVEPQLPDDVWELLFAEKLTDRQFDGLSDAAWNLNRREVDVPFSRAASLAMAPSESE